MFGSNAILPLPKAHKPCISYPLPCIQRLRHGWFYIHWYYKGIFDNHFIFNFEFFSSLFLKAENMFGNNFRFLFSKK